MTATGGTNDAERSGEQPDPAADASSDSAMLSLTQFVQNVALIGAILYVVGLLTTNAYLYRLGVADFSLLRARFVFTGVVTMLPLSIALIGGLYAADELATFGGASAGAARLSRWFLSHVALPSALFFLVFFSLFWYAGGNDPLVAVRAGALISAACAVIVVALLGGLALYQVTGRHAGGAHPRMRSAAFGRFTAWIGIPGAVLETLTLAMAGFLLLLTYIGWFGHHVYPVMPEQLGGGQPRLVQLLVASEAIPAAGELGLHVTPQAPVTAPLELLWEGDDRYVIRLPSPREQVVVELASDLVDGIVTNPGSAPATAARIPPSGAALLAASVR